jgi:hypothetical protein
MLKRSNQQMYLFVYKTSHTNGRYYIGRHQTDNIDDGYLGSGKWVSGIRDKSTLTREIIAEATSFEELCELEEHHISLHYGNPLCMNMKLASIGWSSEDVKARVENGTHNFLGGDISRENSRRRVANGSHNLLGPETNQKRIEDGTHNWVGGNFQSKQQRARVENGTHHFLGGEVARVAAKKQVEAGTHHFLGGEISRKNAARRIDEDTHNFQGDNNPSRQKVKDGTHHFQQPWECQHCGKTGKGVGLFKRWHGDNCKHR